MISHYRLVIALLMPTNRRFNPPKATPSHLANP